MSRNHNAEETRERILNEALMLFIEKGYENTSIQNIINNLGGLSKGAIYYHFDSKEDIFEAICEKLGKQNMAYYDKIRDDKEKNGYEKLKYMLKSSYLNPNNDAVMAMIAKIINDPRFFMNQIMEIFELTAPCYVQPIIEQGVEDGSIQTEYPKELAEVMITLINIWVNPLIAKTAPKGIENKMRLFRQLLSGLGLDIIDEEIIENYVEYFRRYQ